MEGGMMMFEVFRLWPCFQQKGEICAAFPVRHLLRSLTHSE
uniref:Uncharacterized protein n=1 Tax=Anguilla anguilla TaxID=7936 RepID=A0A0E9QGQ1_ANGAN